MNAPFRMLIAAGLMASLDATSVAPVDRECPVCAKPEVGIQLMSYSNFGEPERDLSDQLMFAGPGVEICPHDLFATWPGRRKLVAREQADLARFLNEPALELTAGEKKALGGELEKIRGSRWQKLLWARTCDARRRPDPRHRWWTAMQLHFAGKSAEEPWEKRLAAHFTREAIRELKEAEAADCAMDVEKRIFPYLRAELLRRSGRAPEAKPLFAEVIRKEAAFANDEDTGWIARWATEQSLRIDAAAADAGTLAGWLLNPPPDPWRDGESDSMAGWTRHQVALDVLSERAGSGDRASSDVLWKMIDRQPRNLLAVAESTGGSSRWRGTDPRWAEWFDELQAGIKAERMPDLGREERNEQRVFNVLGRAVSDEPEVKLRERKALMLEIAKSVADEGLPVTGLKGPELLEALGDLLEGEPEQKAAVGRMVIRFFKSAGEDKEDFGYSHRAALVDMCKMPELKGEWAKELGGKWRSGFWKAACDYAAGVPDAADRLAGHPLATRVFAASDGKVGEDLLWQMFAARRDPVWKGKALHALDTRPWLKDEVTNYAFATGDQELRRALHRRAGRLRSGRIEGSGKEMALYEILSVDELIVREKLERLPVR